MRRIVPVAFVIWGLLSLAESACDLKDVKPSGGAVFPDLFAQAVDGYQLTAEFSSDKSKETMLVNEYYSPVYKDGKLEIYRKQDTKTFFYKHTTNETFTISGYNCETGNRLSSPPFLEDGADRWLHFEAKYTVLGPSATIRQGFVTWNQDKSKVGYLGDVEVVRGIKADKWKQCVREGTLYYYFSKPTWRNALNIKDMRVPLRFEYLAEGEKQTTEFFNYRNSLSSPEILFSIPEGYGCKRTADTDEEVPKLQNTNHLIGGELVYHSIKMEAKNYANFVSNFEIVYHRRSEMMAYSYAPWKKGPATINGTIRTGPDTRVIWDNRNKIQYVIDNNQKTCAPQINSDYYPGFELPGDDEGNINLWDPNIFTGTDGFNYLGDNVERGVRVNIFEKEVPLPVSFLNDADGGVGIITRSYARPDVTINTGIQEKETPFRVTLKWFESKEKTKLLGVLVMNIYLFANDIPSIHEKFDVGMCFRDYDAFTWFEITFPNVGVPPADLQRHIPEIENEFLGALIANTETTLWRVQKILVEVNEEDDDFSVEAQILDRPKYELEFNYHGNFQIVVGHLNYTYGMLTKEECLKKCVDYSKNEGAAQPCQTVSFCGATCYISTLKNPQKDDNGQCRMYNRAVVSQSLPSVDELVRSIRTLVVTQQFSLTFLLNHSNPGTAQTFYASSFADSVGDTTDRLVPRLFKEEKFQISMGGMKLIKGEKDKSKPTARYSFANCLQACINNPYCETVSYCRGTECILSESYISDISSDNIQEDNRCTILARNYLQAYKAFSGVVLTRSAMRSAKAKTADGCANYCRKQTQYGCRSFDFCEDTGDCLLHNTHYFQLRDTGEEVKVTESCTHYSKNFVYDFKRLPGKRTVGDTARYVRQMSVEECAKECAESGDYDCTAFDFCEGLIELDNKCFLISTKPNETKTVNMASCSHYVNQGVNYLTFPAPKKRYTTALAGGLGFLFFLIGAAIGVAATYFIAFRFVNKK